MIGVLFTMPQYSQGVLGSDAMGSGLRLLPMIGGIVVGAVPTDRLASRVGTKITVALGFVVLGAGTPLGATTGAGSGDGFVAARMAGVGVWEQALSAPRLPPPRSTRSHRRGAGWARP